MILTHTLVVVNLVTIILDMIAVVNKACYFNNLNPIAGKAEIILPI